MRKLFLFLMVAVIAMTTGCDPVCHYYYDIKNGMDYDEITVKLEGQEMMTISSGEKKTILDELNHGDVGDYYDMEAKMSYLEIKINDIPMPHTIWQRKYWEYASNSKSYATYTLTVTDELIENILSIDTTY